MVDVLFKKLGYGDRGTGLAS